MNPTILRTVRAFHAPFYPLFPAFALLGAGVCMAAMIYYNPLIFDIFVAFLAFGYGYFRLTGHHRDNAVFAAAQRAGS